MAQWDPCFTLMLSETTEWCPTIGDMIRDDDAEAYMALGIASRTWRITSYGRSEHMLLWGYSWQRCRCYRWEYEMCAAIDSGEALCRWCHRSRRLIRWQLELFRDHRVFGLHAVVWRLADFLVYSNHSVPGLTETR